MMNMNKFLSRLRPKAAPGDDQPIEAQAPEEMPLPAEESSAEPSKSAQSQHLQTNTQGDQEIDAKMLTIIFRNYENSPTLMRMRLRLKEMGIKHLDEVEHFRVLQKACRNDETLKEDLKTAGFGDISAMKPTHPTPELGRIVQAFNHFVEQTWTE